jgi:hypothetical protein
MEIEMKKKTLLIPIIALLLSCQQIKLKLGLGDKIVNPPPGSPEKVVQEVLKSALQGDPEAGWEAFSVLLHSDEQQSPAALNDWRTMRFPAIRKKVSYLVEDKASATYTLMDKREEGQSLILYVKNSQSDMPTPCKLRKDPQNGNAWRVFNACF